MQRMVHMWRTRLRGALAFAFAHVAAGGEVSTRRPAWGVTITREDGLWVAVVNGLTGGATDVEHFTELDSEVRDLIAGLTDVDPHEFDVEWHVPAGSHRRDAERDVELPRYRGCAGTAPPAGRPAGGRVPASSDIGAQRIGLSTSIPT